MPQEITNADVLHHLMSFDLKSTTDYQIQDQLTYMIENGVPAIQLVLPIGSVITRLRMGVNYYEEKDLSYKPSALCTAYQRASLPGETVFYGVISDNENRLDHARIISVNECSPMCRKSKEKGIEEFTCSQWITTTKLKLLGFFSSQTFTDCSDNELIEQCRGYYEKMLERVTASEQKDWEDIAGFLSHQFYKRVPDGHDYEYKITANLSSIIHRLPYSYDGIAYPSERTNGILGLNVALFPEAADRSLCFCRKAKQVLYKNKDIVIPRIEGYAEDVSAEFAKTFHFSDEELFQRLKIRDFGELRG